MFLSWDISLIIIALVVILIDSSIKASIKNREQYILGKENLAERREAARFEPTFERDSADNATSFNKLRPDYITTKSFIYDSNFFN